jgi:hypothetical protein
MATSISFFGTSRSFVRPCDDTTRPSCKKIEKTVVNALTTRAQFINAVSQEVRLRSSEFVAEFHQPAYSSGALDLNVPGHCVEPSKERNRTAFAFVKVEINPWHATPRMFSLLITPVNPQAAACGRI